MSPRIVQVSFPDVIDIDDDESLIERFEQRLEDDRLADIGMQIANLENELALLEELERLFNV